MKVPGPDHPISITPSGKHIRVTAGDTVIADSTKAVTLKEAVPPGSTLTNAGWTVMAKVGAGTKTCSVAVLLTTNPVPLRTRHL